MLGVYVGVYNFLFLKFKGLEPGGRLRGRRAEEMKWKKGKTKEKG